MTLLICNDGLIGDFLGVVPVAIELSKKDELHMRINPDALPIFDLIPKKYHIGQQDRNENQYDRVLTLNISDSFAIAAERNYFMTQANFAQLHLKVPALPVKAELEFEPVEVPVYDYIIAPFSRSLPPEQCWGRERWQNLVGLKEESSFCVIGHGRDERKYITGVNVSEMYHESLLKVISLLKKARKGLISVVSGPSHLAFHLGVKNYLLTNQNMTWGNNPEAVRIEDHIPDLKAEKLAEVLNQHCSS